MSEFAISPRVAATLFVSPTVDSLGVRGVPNPAANQSSISSRRAWTERSWVRAPLSPMSASPRQLWEKLLSSTNIGSTSKFSNDSSRISCLTAVAYPQLLVSDHAALTCFPFTPAI